MNCIFYPVGIIIHKDIVGKTGKIRGQHTYFKCIGTGRFSRQVTGWDLTMEDVLQIGERATNLARVFNAREGFTRQDDTLPERLYQKLENGALQGESMLRDEFEQALTVLCGLKGWNPDTGMPTRSRLEELSLGWAADLLD